jgi:hypothetical protein
VVPDVAVCTTLMPRPSVLPDRIFLVNVAMMAS